MEKKDIYEYLAKIYWDASQKKKKKTKNYPLPRNFLIIGLVFILSFGFLFLNTPRHSKKESLNSQLSLVIHPDVAKINFNFDPARKEIFSIDLKRLNVSGFKTLSFFSRKANYRNAISLRVEFTNVFKEKSAVYLKDLPYGWKEYNLSLLDFKNISDWSEMLNLSFIVEQWNTKEDSGVVYLDNIALLR